MTLVDQDNRVRAMTDFTSVLLVEAAAGTGKTSLMAGRVAMMLAAGFPPGDIAAITFTDLAASQLARRTRETVEALLAGDIPDFIRPVLPSGRLTDSQQAALAAAAPRLDELTATTIHGFCQAVIHSHGVQAGLDPGARIVDETVAEAMFRGELSAWFSRRLAEAAIEDDPIVVLAEKIPLKVVGLIHELAKLRREHPEAAPIQPLQSTRPDIVFAQAVDDFYRWQTSIDNDNCVRGIAHELRRLSARYERIFDSPPDFATLWQLCDAGPCRLFAKGLQLKTYVDAAESFGAYPGESASDAAIQHYQIVTDAWNELIGHIASALVCILSSSLDLLLKSYEGRKRAAAVLDFDDLLLHVRSLVRGHEEVRRAIGRRYKHILVDEFQDTDRVQSEILFSIAATDERVERWEERRLRPGSLFLVGDPKQAIYRFRGADIEIYELCRRLVGAQEGGAVIEVTANFRSQKAIIRHVNSCFETVFGKTGQPRYVALAPTIPDGSYPIPCMTRFTIQVVTDGRIYAEMFREAEAEKVADICSRLIGNVTIRRADGSFSSLQPGDIALLSPGHRDLWRYERALEQRNLAVSSQAGQSLMRRQETQDILALLRVLADSSDTLAFGALMRGPLVGLSDQELLDITAGLPEIEGRPNFFGVRTDPSAVNHPVAKAVLVCLRDLRGRAAISTPSLILAEAIERLNARVIMAARHRNRNARALANLDALIERARGYGVAGLRAFVRDLQADWEGNERAPEGRIDAAEHAIEIVTIHKAKGLEWPVVIPINSTTELYRPDQFVHRQSDNTLHWMVGGVAPPDLAAARAEESREDANQRERIWYVACTRARDLLILPYIPQAAKDSWFSSIVLRQGELPELDVSGFHASGVRQAAANENTQSADTFATEQERMNESALPVVWRRPSDHDRDRLGDPIDAVVVTESLAEQMEVVGGGAQRGIILHKLMEELLTGELDAQERLVVSRAEELLVQLLTDADEKKTRPDPIEMARCALRALALPEIAELRPFLLPEVAIWASGEGVLVAGRADALAIREGRVEVAVDWKSDVNPSSAVRNRYAAQLKDYLVATGARRGILAFLSLGEITGVENPASLLAPSPEQGDAVQEGRPS
ncbi:UvrD-helicase domain-containing protein [Bradyrhizobium sp. 170]|uniref:UvrD-helicase domain-containing protein n=1 Tax=Bradyrhizobium sp. 170 TaxID=2782641 RepID=UPI001FFF0FB5|nr:UvrD-helicase domain-containing protein [Bradyrhizobium sp. 170]UPK01438.1 UvrD-helicase domain-containing protein [Bradyrhizobium sp. 170]